MQRNEVGKGAGMRRHVMAMLGMAVLAGAWGLASCAAPRAGAPLAGAADPAADRVPPAMPAEGPLVLSVEQAVLLGLARNPALEVERFGPRIQRTREDEEQARFDTQLGAGGGAGRDTLAGGAEARRREAEIEISRRLAFGTVLGADASWRRDEAGEAAPEAHRVRAGLSATQPLLQGAGAAANRAAWRQAQLARRMSEHELRGFAETLAADIEQACWSHALAQRRVGIVRESAELAEQQLQEVTRRIEVGTLAETERAAARAEVALRREALINAMSQAEAARLRLLRLLDPDGDWDRAVTVRDEPVLPEAPGATEAPAVRAARALALRPEVRQARLAIEREDLEVVRTRNGLLPRLDFFVRLGRTGYAEAFGDAADLGDAADDWSAGLRLDLPLGRRGERARHARGLLARERAEAALRNLERLIELEVRLGAIEVDRTAEQISATAATRAFREETLRAEMEKFRVGRSTALLVAQAQRDAMDGRLAEAEAIAQYLQARVRLERLEGTLLDRRGIAIPR
jgi:outer membrane protein